MTEPPRPPGTGDPGHEPPTEPFYAAPPGGRYDPATEPMHATGQYEPTEAMSAPPPTAGQYEPPTAGQYEPPTEAMHAHTAGQYEPPTEAMHAATPPGGYPPPAEAYPPPPQSGGAYPPGYSGGPAGGYPGGGPAAPGHASGDDKTWALIAHFGGPVGIVVGFTIFGWVGPLIALLAKGQQSPVVRAHAVAALNFQITWAIAVLVGWLLALVTCGILSFVPLLTALVPIVFGIIGGVRASEGTLYRYPMTRGFVK